MKKVLVGHLLFLHHFSLLYANINVQQIPKQNIVEVTENMYRLLTFRITGEDTANIIIKYLVNETTSHHPENALNINDLYTSTVVDCTSGSSLQCKELQILVQGKWEIHMTSFRIQVFILPDSGKIQEIVTAEYFMVHFKQVQNSFTPGTSSSPTTQNEVSTHQTSAASQISSSMPMHPSTPTTTQTSSFPMCPNSINMKDLTRPANLPFLITLGGLAMAFVVSFAMNVIFVCRLRRQSRATKLTIATEET